MQAHKFCKTNFFNPIFVSNKNLKPELPDPRLQMPDENSISENSLNVDVEMTSPECPRRSSRHDQVYHSSLDDVQCIICNNSKKDSHGKIVPVRTMSLKYSNKKVHMAEKQLKDFATLHKHKNTKYKAAADRIFLSLSTSDSLFAANVIQGLRN